MKFAVFATIAIALVACAHAATVKEACDKEVADAWTGCGKALRSGKTCSTSCRAALRLTKSFDCFMALSAASSSLSPSMLRKVEVIVCRHIVCVCTHRCRDAGA